MQFFILVFLLYLELKVAKLVKLRNNFQKMICKFLSCCFKDINILNIALLSWENCCCWRYQEHSFKETYLERSDFEMFGMTIYKIFWLFLFSYFSWYIPNYDTARKVLGILTIKCLTFLNLLISYISLFMTILKIHWIHR